MGRQAKTQNIIDQAHEILEAYHPMTVRQVYYQLVSRQIIENNRSRYQAVSNALVDARLEEIIPWDWIEDWLRKPHSSDGSYDDLADFAKYVQYYYPRDFDPSGEEMVTSLRKRLAKLGSNPEIIKVSLTKDEVLRYNLPHDFTMDTDTRSKKFIEKYGDMAVELDALPATVLQARIVEEVEKYVDLAALDAIKEVEKQEREKLVEVLPAIS